MPKTFTCQAIIIKRRNYREADRIVVLYTREYGKLTARAKGVRKQQSRKKSSLEPATNGRYQLVLTKGFPLIVQSTITNTHANARQNLVRLTQIHQLLEVIDTLTVDEHPNEEIFDLLESSLSLLDCEGLHKASLLHNIHRMIISMGFSTPNVLSEAALQYQIESITEKHLRSKAFLTPSYLRLE